MLSVKGENIKQDSDHCPAFSLSFTGTPCVLIVKQIFEPPAGIIGLPHKTFSFHHCAFLPSICEDLQKMKRKMLQILFLVKGPTLPSRSLLLFVFAVFCKPCTQTQHIPTDQCTIENIQHISNEPQRADSSGKTL